MDASGTGPNSMFQCEGLNTDYNEKCADATQFGDTDASTGTKGGNENKRDVDGYGIAVYVGSDGTEYRFCVVR